MTDYLEKLLSELLPLSIDGVISKLKCMNCKSSAKHVSGGGIMSLQEKFYLNQRKPSGIYYYIVRDPISRKTIAFKSTGTTDEKQAKALALEWWTNGVSDKPFTGIDRKSLLCDYLTYLWDFSTSQYFRELKAMGKSPEPEHALETQKLVARYFKPYFKDLLLCQLNEEALQKFIVYLKIDRGFSASTVNKVRNCAFVALKYAKRKKLFNHSFDFDAVLRAGGKSKQRGTLSNNEGDALFSRKNIEIWTNKKSRLINFISYSTGCRISEVCCLRLCDVQKSKLTIKHSWSVKKNRQKSLKNKDELKIVPIMPNLYDEIMEYIKENKIFKLDALLFSGIKSHIPYNSVQIRKNLYKALNKIGISNEERISRNLVFHSYRNRLAKTMVENGVNKSIAMKILGIKTERTFMNYASGFDNETLDQMTEAIQKISTPAIQPKEPIPFKKIV